MIMAAMTVERRRLKEQMADYSNAKKLTDEVLRIGTLPPSLKNQRKRAQGEGLHITIGVAPSSTATIENELRLIKAALLYADHAKLCSQARRSAGMGRTEAL